MATETVRGAVFDTNELVLNMGPQHPSTHGCWVVLRLDGEKVVDADDVIGYLHRGIEKLSENRNDADHPAHRPDDYVAAATSNVGYCETVEKLLQIEVPRRALRAHDSLRAAAHREPLPLGRHARDGHQRDDGVSYAASAS
jgi:NADH-quinone oxidoreductase subunit D